MSLVRCQYCRAKIKARLIKVHEHKCVVRRKRLKAEKNQEITQTIDYRLGRLRSFNIDLEAYDLSTMTDIGFNDLLSRLEVAKKLEAEQELVIRKEQLKKAELETKAKLTEIANQKADISKKEEAREIQAEQSNRVAESLEKETLRDEKRKADIAESLKTTLEPTTEEIAIIEKDKAIELAKNSLGKVPLKKEKIATELTYKELQDLFKDKFPDKRANLKKADLIKALGL